MDETLLLGSVVATSLMAWWFGRRVVGLSGVPFMSVLARTLECLGFAAIFLGLNLVLGIIGVLAVRSITTRFVSLYVFTDVVLVVLSFFQGLAARWWWQLSR